jgi:RNA polymerase sigma-70 factor (ECF subfamily)
MYLEDYKIVDLYWARSEDAIRQTEIKYGRMLVSISSALVPTVQDAEECVSDTYLRTWNSIPPKRPSSLKAFLGKIARNLSIDRLRHRHIARHDSDLEIMLSELEPYLPAREEEESTLTELLDGFLSGLEPLERQLFMGRYWHAYPVNRLADHYGLTPNAVSLRLHRTREKLRDYLEKGGITL